MQRRELLAALGMTAATVLAGCSGGSDDGNESDDDGSDDGSGSDDSGSDDGSDGSTDDSGDDSSDDDGDDTPEYDVNEAVEALRTYLNAEELETATSLLHSRTSADPTTLGDVLEQSYTVLEENIDRSRLAELVGEQGGIDDEDIDAMAEGVVVVIEADLVLEFRGSETEDTQPYVLATEDGEWRVVQRALGLD